jgi:thioredoxin 1
VNKKTIKDMISYKVEVNDENFDSFTSEGLVLIDVKAEWCSPCKQIAPIVDQVSGEYVGRLKVGVVDADMSPATVEKLGVRSIPTLIVYKDGKKVSSSTGMATKAKIVELFEKHLQ